jgi:aryl-alcohol dehydrogenase-like predicted oxidoreductase
MEYRELGRTGIKVSNLSFGTSSLGGVFQPINKKEGIKTVRTAVDLGINLIDSSPYYGDLRAEKILGSALRKIPRDRYYLSTKIGRYWHNGKKYWDYSSKKAVESVDQSLKRMHSEYIDFIHCHDIEFAEPDQIVNDTLPALHRLKDSGKIRWVGITGLPLDNLVGIIERSSQDKMDVILTFCHYTLQDDSLKDYIDYFRSNQIGIINASPLGMGLLTDKGVPDWHPADPLIRDLCSRAGSYCRKKGEKIEKLAIQFSTQLKDIPTTLVSTADPDIIAENIKWSGEPLDHDLLQEVLKILKPVHRKTWKNS